VDEVTAAVPAEPRLRLDDHREEARVKRDPERVSVHSFGDSGVDFDDAELQSSNVLVGVRESGLDLGAETPRGRRERESKWSGQRTRLSAKEKEPNERERATHIYSCVIGC
jgi:hypothetical protein